MLGRKPGSSLSSKLMHYCGLAELSIEWRFLVSEFRNLVEQTRDKLILKLPLYTGAEMSLVESKYQPKAKKLNQRKRAGSTGHLAFVEV